MISKAGEIQGHHTGFRFSPALGPSTLNTLKGTIGAPWPSRAGRVRGTSYLIKKAGLPNQIGQ